MMLRSLAISFALVASVALVGCSADTTEPQPSSESESSDSKKEETPNVEVNTDNTINPLACLPVIIPTWCGSSGFTCETSGPVFNRCRRCYCN